jgi:hypothetical protein
MKKLALSTVAAVLCLLGSNAFAEINGTMTIKHLTSGTTLHDRLPILHVILSNSPSTAGLRPYRITIGFGQGSTFVTLNITSSDYTRVIDFHKAIVAAMQSGGFTLNARVPSAVISTSYDLNLDTGLITLLQF